ncbi:MAG: hypothetical protein AAGU77_11570, partial [Bacillota bacterium]
MRIPAQSIKEHKAVAGYDCHQYRANYTSRNLFIFRRKRFLCTYAAWFAIIFLNISSGEVQNGRNQAGHRKKGLEKVS